MRNIAVAVIWFVVYGVTFDINLIILIGFPAYIDDEQRASAQLLSGALVGIKRLVSQKILRCSSDTGGSHAGWRATPSMSNR